MRSSLIKALLITVLNIVLGSIIAWFVSVILNKTNQYFNLNPDVQLSWKSIIHNNTKFILIYSIPIFGCISYIVSFSFIYILIGVSLTSMGLSYTVQKLVHLPLEVFALSLPLVIFSDKSSIKKQRILLLLISYASIVIAALIESNL